MGVQGKELVNLTWDQVDLERGLLHLPERDMLLTNAVRRLLEKVQKVRSPGEDPHVLLSPSPGGLWIWPGCPRWCRRR